MKNESTAEMPPQPVTLTPMAYLNDVGGKKIVVRIGDTNEFALLTPPTYALEGAMRGEWVRDAALAKYGFSEFTEEQAAVGMSEELKKFAK